ncbi:hypothetical protein EON76_01735 [bacterium]|nr:MAG: hypothetical protein EON76_01735 [bacterium]
MDSTILAIRAITSLYVKRLLLPILVIGLGVYVVIIGLIWWIAASVSNWWWLLATVPTVVLLIGLAIWVVVRILVGRIAPPMNKPQTVAANKFIKRIDGVAERIGTPKFVVIYRVIKDVLFRPISGKTYIGEIASEPGEARREFDELRSLF